MATDQNFQHLIPKRTLTKNTIILDIDETLVHTEEDMKSLEKMDILSRPELLNEIYFLSLDNGATEMWGTKRPHVDDFLLFCFTYFDNVCVWSAGQKDYVHTLVDHLFAPFKKPDIVFTFDDCVQNKDENWIKPLEKFYQHPLARGKISPENTFIIDDRDYTFERNEKNGILIPPYSPNNLEEIQKEDDHLSRLRSWFLHPEKRFTNDIQTLDKADIFTRTPEQYSEQLQQIYSLA